MDFKVRNWSFLAVEGTEHLVGKPECAGEAGTNRSEFPKQDDDRRKEGKELILSVG
jgi:hypothetical protein